MKILIFSPPLWILAEIKERTVAALRSVIKNLRILGILGIIKIQGLEFWPCGWFLIFLKKKEKDEKDKNSRS